MWHRAAAVRHLRGYVYRSVLSNAVNVACSEGAISRARHDAVLQSAESAHAVLATEPETSPKYAAAREAIATSYRSVEMSRRWRLDRDDSPVHEVASARLYRLLCDKQPRHASYFARKHAGSRYAQLHGKGRCKVRPATEGVTYAVHNFRGVVWIGGSCVYTDRTQWSLLQVTNRAALVMTWVDNTGVARRRRIETENWRCTGAPEQGTLTSINVAGLSRCSVIALNPGAISYDRVLPYHKIVYVQAPCRGAVVIAQIRSDNALVCIGCGKVFGSDTNALAKHVGLEGRWANLQWHTHPSPVHGLTT